MNWIPLVDNSTQRIIEQKLSDIFKIVAQYRPDKSLGLLGGYSGILLFFYYYYKYTERKDVLMLLNERFNFIYSDFLQIGHASFGNGYSGVCWLIRFLVNERIIETNDIDDALCDVDALISQHMVTEMQRNNYDFLHGSLGMAYYFATAIKSGNESMDKAIRLFLESLYNKAEHIPNGGFRWLTDVYVDNKKVGLVYNLSLSHGMAAIIAFLTKLIKQNSNKELAITLLSKVIVFYKHSINPVNYVSTFPKWFDQHNTRPSESPLSWCYGDPGIAQALYSAGMTIQDDELSKLALSALFKTTHRKDIEKEYIKEACFCHGSASLCHIYNRLYQNTKLDLFKDYAVYWLNDILTKGNNLSNLAGYEFYDNGFAASSYNIIAGLSGVGLSLLATIDTEIPKWDECVLLS